MSQHHELKTETIYYQAVERGCKRFEARKNDRKFRVYDKVTLIETMDGKPTGRKFGPVEIDYIMAGPAYGIEDGYCVFTWSNDHQSIFGAIH